MIQLFEKQNRPQSSKANVSLNGECITPPLASHILHSRVTPANINICFSFQAAVLLCSGGVKKEERLSVANVTFRQDIIVTNIQPVK